MAYSDKASGRLVSLCSPSDDQTPRFMGKGIYWSATQIRLSIFEHEKRPVAAGALIRAGIEILVVWLRRRHIPVVSTKRLSRITFFYAAGHLSIRRCFAACRESTSCIAVSTCGQLVGMIEPAVDFVEVVHVELSYEV